MFTVISWGGGVVVVVWLLFLLLLLFFLLLWLFSLFGCCCFLGCCCLAVSVCFFLFFFRCCCCCCCCFLVFVFCWSQHTQKKKRNHSLFSSVLGGPFPLFPFFVLVFLFFSLSLIFFFPFLLESLDVVYMAALRQPDDIRQTQISTFLFSRTVPTTMQSSSQQHFQEFPLL